MKRFISYAQNFEDVILWRALSQVRKGTYVDVGANHPVTDSVSFAFYDRGWTGINIDAAEEWYRLLQQERKRDINVWAGCSNEPGELTLYEFPGSGLSTMRKDISERHQRERGLKPLERLVAVRTLDEILESYGVASIHFLKIDVEGFEKQVLSGLNLEKNRPWIILIEATEPNSQVASFAEWEPLLTSQGYTQVYFDGLNRYYLAPEKDELSEYFALPLNFQDCFVRYEQVQEVENLKQELAEIHQELGKIHQSKSWRWTKLLRRLSESISRSRNRAGPH